MATLPPSLYITSRNRAFYQGCCRSTCITDLSLLGLVPAMVVGQHLQGIPEIAGDPRNSRGSKKKQLFVMGDNGRTAAGEEKKRNDHVWLADRFFASTIRNFLAGIVMTLVNPTGYVSFFCFVDGRT